jgi:hypothetical protein
MADVPNSRHAMSPMALFKNALFHLFIVWTVDPVYAQKSRVTCGWYSVPCRGSPIAKQTLQQPVFAETT